VSGVPMVPVGELMVSRGGSVNPLNFPDEDFDLYSISAFDAGKPEVTVGVDIGSTKQVVQPNDVLLSKIVPHIRRAWVVGADRGRRLIGSGEWILFRSERVWPEYLRHVLVGDPFHQQFMQTVSGVGGSLLRARPAFVAGISIPLPPLEEQRRIAAILDQAETLRTQRRQALAHLDTLTQSLFLDMFGDPRSNPKGWREAPVGALTDCIVPGRDKPKSFSGGIPWVTTANLIHMGATLPLADALGLSKAEIDEVRAKVIPAGSVIISCVGDLGVVSIAGVPMVINQQLHSFQCGAELNNLFLMHSLSFQKAFMLAKASSTTLPYMNKSVCNSIPVLVPPLPLQQTFATRIQAIEALKATHRTVLAQLDALFASLQQRAFAGEL
jgi:type I restriction enzyme, S subunit